MYKHKNGLTFRKIEKTDLLVLKDLLDTTWYGRHTWSFNNMDDQEDWFNAQRKNKSQMLFMVYKKVGYGEDQIGLYKLLNIDLINRTADSSHDVFAKQQGKGYGHAVLQGGVDMAFELLNLDRLDTQVLTNNHASRKTAIKAGFTPEGMRREAVYKCGDRLDSEVFGLLRRDWVQLERLEEYNGCCNVSYVPKDNKEIDG